MIRKNSSRLWNLNALSRQVNYWAWGFNSRQISVRGKLEHRFPISFMTVRLFEPCFTLFLSFGVSAQLKSPPIIKLLSEDPRRVWFKFWWNLICCGMSFGAYTLARTRFWLYSLISKIIDLPLLSLVLLITCNWYLGLTRIITPLLWFDPGL